MRAKRAWVMRTIVVCLVIGGLAVPAYAGKKKREKHADKWPAVDLGAYSVLWIEDFAMTDPKAEERKKVVQVKGAPKRLGDYLQQALDTDLFEQVHRGASADLGAGSLIVRGEITQYKPGSAVGRAMMAGAGSAHLDFVVHLIDGATGRELTSFDAKRTWAWGGAMGMTKGVDDMEQNVAHELALYLRKCKTGSIQ